VDWKLSIKETCDTNLNTILVTKSITMENIFYLYFVSVVCLNVEVCDCVGMY